jgi:hypothetical protein
MFYCVKTASRDADAIFISLRTTGQFEFKTYIYDITMINYAYDKKLHRVGRCIFVRAI